jgi:hypothetical protein
MTAMQALAITAGVDHDRLVMRNSRGVLQGR